MLSIMRPSSAFVPAATTGPRALLTFRSTALGRPVIFRIAPTRRTSLRPIVCQEQQPGAEAASDPEAELPAEAASEPAATEAVVPDASEATDPVAEAPAAEEAVATEAPIASSAEPEADAAEAETEDAAVEPVSADAGTEKKRRRRSRPKKEVTLPLEDLTPGMEVEGLVKGVMDYGAFIGDFGAPTDGLLHVSQLAAGYVQNVSDVVKVGDKVKVRVLSVDLEKGTFSLTMKTQEQLDAGKQDRRERDAPQVNRREEQKKKWETFEYDPEVFLDAKVISVTDFGGFCKLLNPDGTPMESAPTDGLVHISELSVDRVESVSDVLSVGDLVKVRVVTIDKKRNRISMSLKAPGEVSSSSEGGGDSKMSADVAADLERLRESQPEFKTTFELAFEKARGAVKN